MPNFKPNPRRNLVPHGILMEGGRRLWKVLVVFEVKRRMLEGSVAVSRSAFCRTDSSSWISMS